MGRSVFPASRSVQIERLGGVPLGSIDPSDVATKESEFRSEDVHLLSIQF